MLEGASSLGAEAIGDGAVVAPLADGDGATLTIAINLGDEAVDASVPDAPLLFAAGSAARARQLRGVAGMSALHELAAAAGLQVDWTDAAGQAQRVSDEALARRARRARLCRRATTRRSTD